MKHDVHEICVVVCVFWHIDTKTKQSVDDRTEYHSCFVDKELARRACVILKYEDEISGMQFTRYEVLDDVMQYDLPDQDPGMALSPDEIEARLG